MLSQPLLRRNDQAPVESLRPVVIVFAPLLLPYSETFIRSHVQTLHEFRPILTGLERTAGLDLQGIETATIGDGLVDRLMLRLGYSRKLDRLFTQYDVKLVHCHFMHVAPFLTAYCKRRRVPLVVSIHGADVLRKRRETFVSSILSKLQPRPADVVDLFLPVSNWLLEQAVKRGVPKEKCVRHYLGIPLHPKHTGRKAGKTVTIIAVGRLVEKKGPSYLIEAVRELAKSRSDFNVRVVGDGPLRASAQAASEKLELPITFLGALPPDQVLAEMDAADIFCLPSTQAADGDNEGLALVHLEAQSRSLPVVGFDQGPIPEAVANGTTGILVRDRDARALSQALASLIDDPARRQAMGEAGRRFVEERFDILKQTPKLEELYRRVLATPTGSALRTASGPSPRRA